METQVKRADWNGSLRTLLLAFKRKTLGQASCESQSCLKGGGERRREAAGATQLDGAAGSQAVRSFGEVRKAHLGSG